MKKRPPSHRFRSILLSGFTLACTAIPSQATVLYWDTNGTAAGSGNAGGTWDTTTTTLWNTDSTGAGGGAFQAFATGDTANFSAGTDGTGSLTFNVSGTIQAAAINFLQNGSKTVAGGSLSIASNLAISSAGRSNSDTYTISSLLTGIGSLTLAANGDTSDTGGGVGGALILNNGANDFIGGVNITSGVVSFVSDGAFGNASNVITISGGGLVSQGTRTLNHNITLAGGGDRIFRCYGAPNIFTINGAITGAGNVRHTDGGTLQLNGNNSFTGNMLAAGGAGRILALGGVNTYTGYTHVLNTSTLRLDVNNALPDGTTVLLYGGTTFNANGKTDTFGSLTTGSSSDTTVIVNLGSGANLKITNNNLPSGLTSGYSNATIHGKITGTGNIEYAHGSADTAQWDIANTTNDFLGNWTVTRGRLRFLPNATTDTTLGNAENDIIFNGDVVNTLNNGGGKASIQVTNGTAITFAATRTTILNTGKEGTYYVWGGTTQTLNGKITGGGNLRKEDSGVLLLNNTTSDYTGETRIVLGEVRLGAAGSLPDASLVRIGGGFLNIQGFTETVSGLSSVQPSDNALLTGGYVIGTGPASMLALSGSSTQEFAGVINNMAMRLDGTGIQKLSGPADNVGGQAIVNSGTLILAKASSGSVHAVGATDTTGLTINGGTLLLGGSGGDQIYTQAHVLMTGGSFDLNGFNEGFRVLKGAAGIVTNNGGASAILTVGENGVATDNYSFSGTLMDGTASLGLTKVGNGSLTLSGANTYSGTTNLNGGTLLLGNSNVLPNTAATNLSTGTKLVTAGFSDATGTVTLNGTVTIDLGGGSGTSSLTFNNIGTWSGVLNVWNWNGTPNTAGVSGLNTRLIFSSGTLTSGQLADVHFFSNNGTSEVGTGGGIFVGTELVAVPEPTTAMSAFLLLGVIGYRERRKKSLGR